MHHLTAASLCVALTLGAAACSKTPDGPGGPSRPTAPKTALAAPVPPPAEPVGAIRIPATPADGSGLPGGRPSRIWM